MEVFSIKISKNKIKKEKMEKNDVEKAKEIMKKYDPALVAIAENE